ncbi:MAG: type VI secretion system ATPase TssH [Phycisphaerales bacterium]|nr:type VI secretion system ATPase TssH [Phycisphaerales bacterium]
MAEISRVKLFGKLNSLCYKALEASTVFCKLRGNPYVEIVHWVQQILQNQDSDLHQLIRHFQINPSKLASDITAALDRLPRGSTSISDLSGHLDATVKEAWGFATLMFGESQVRSGHLMVAWVKTEALRPVLLSVSREFEKIKPDTLTDEFAQLLRASPEEGQIASDGSGMGAGAGAAPGESSGAIAPAQLGKEEALKRFCVDLTENARAGKMDPIVGRDEEIRQCVDILMRRRQNNPILTGEAGVGKTAVVEGFAQRIVAGDVPPQLKDVRMLALDIGLLQAGASMKGEFENRLRQVIDEVQASTRPIILFIDECHTLIGAGGAAGQNDAANLLKPALARGTLRTIGATTQAEYKKYFEKDPALTRRFQVVKVDEPDEKKALLMIRGLAGVMEKHFKIQVLDEALENAVKLSKRYIQGRQLPDKAVSLLDTACARVAVSLHAVPARIDDCRRRIEGLRTELAIIDRETAIGVDHADRRKEVVSSLEAEQARLKDLDAHFAREKELVEKILAIRGKLRAGGVSPDTGAAVATAAPQAAAAANGAAPQAAAAANGAAPMAQPLSEDARLAAMEELKKLQAELASLQGENPLILPSVDGQAVASVVADWTGIPVGRMVRNEIESVLKLADTLEKRVIGQRHGLEEIAKRIQLSRAKLDNPQRPIGVFMLVGPSGVGKTETAIALAESLYGGTHALITINMSEYQEAHKVSTLMGSPPGYVGYGQGGVLTEAVRRRPYSVVLLDEVEKAHADVHEIFFQVFDKGMMKDSEGVDIDFKNTIILLTSNAGTDLVVNMCKDPELKPDPEALQKALREPLLKVFPPALLGRINVVPYYPISDSMMRSIIALQLSRIARRVEEGHRVPFTYDPAVVETIVARCTELESGARAIDAIITRQMLPRIGREILERMVEGKPIEKVHVAVKDSEFEYAF